MITIRFALRCSAQTVVDFAYKPEAVVVIKSVPWCRSYDPGSQKPRRRQPAARPGRLCDVAHRRALNTATDDAVCSTATCHHLRRWQARAPRECCSS